MFQIRSSNLYTLKKKKKKKKKRFRDVVVKPFKNHYQSVFLIIYLKRL